MGHGYNHFYDCTCRWCVNYRKGRSKDQKNQEKIEFEKRIYELNEYFSTTYPNAKCFKCGDAIFFYANSNGSRVFFDSLGKPWPKHKCYYNDFWEDFEIDLNIENLPKLNFNKVQSDTHLVHVIPKIYDHFLNGYVGVSFNDRQGTIKEFVIKFSKQEFGLCFYDETEKILNCFVNDENYSIECLTTDEAKSLRVQVFAYEIGQVTTIELFRDNVHREKVQVFYSLKVKNFIARPEAYMVIKKMNELTLQSLYKSGRNGISVKVISTLDKNDQIEFIEVE